MNILYYTNIRYAWNVQGTTRSIAEEVEKRGHAVKIIDRNQIGSILQHIDSFKPDTVWLASSNILIEQFKSKIKIPIVGFGFSDPYIFTTKRFKSYDIYVTNHEETMKKYSSIIPMIYNPTACDLKFHKNMELQKTIDISCIGTLNHPRFKDPQMRPKTAKKLKNDGLVIDTYGDGWVKLDGPRNHKAVSGRGFLDVINRSKIGIDLQDPGAPLAHRMLEYGACGTPCITRDRPEIYNLFTKDEILTYTDYEDLRDKLKYYLSHEKELKKFGQKLEEKCKTQHNITNRIDHLLKELQY